MSFKDFFEENFIVFESLIYESSSKSYYLASINPIFHGLSFGIKFITSPIWNYSVTSLKKYYFQPRILQVRV
jgi:hypothetical protein